MAWGELGPGADGFGGTEQFGVTEFGTEDGGEDRADTVELLDHLIPLVVSKHVGDTGIQFGVSQVVYSQQFSYRGGYRRLNILRAKLERLGGPVEERAPRRPCDGASLGLEL